MSNLDESERRRRVLEALSAGGAALSTAIVLFHTNLAARLGLGPTEIKVLELVARHGSLSPKALRAQTGLAPASITGILDRLEAKQFVERRPSPHDGRSIEVVHSPRHTEVVRGLFSGLLAGLDRLYDRYSIEQLELIQGYLECAADIQQRAALDLVNTIDEPDAAAPERATAANVDGPSTPGRSRR